MSSELPPEEVDDARDLMAEDSTYSIVWWFELSGIVKWFEPSSESKSMTGTAATGHDDASEMNAFPVDDTMVSGDVELDVGTENGIR